MRENLTNHPLDLIISLEFNKNYYDYENRSDFVLSACLMLIYNNEQFALTELSIDLI